MLKCIQKKSTIVSRLVLLDSKIELFKAAISKFNHQVSLLEKNNIELKSIINSSRSKI